VSSSPFRGCVYALLPALVLWALIITAIGRAL